METVITSVKVEDGDRWAKAWKEGAGSRHEMFGKIGVTVRTFRDPENPDSVGLLLEVPDMDRFQSFMASDENVRGMEQDGLKPETLRVLREFTP